MFNKKKLRVSFRKVRLLVIYSSDRNPAITTTYGRIRHWLLAL